MKITVKGKDLIFKPDCNIYEIYYKGIEIGYVIKERLKDCITAIITEGFYDGRDYTMRISNIDTKGHI